MKTNTYTIYVGNGEYQNLEFAQYVAKQIELRPNEVIAEDFTEVGGFVVFQNDLKLVQADQLIEAH